MEEATATTTTSLRSLALTTMAERRATGGKSDQLRLCAARGRNRGQRCRRDGMQGDKDAEPREASDRKGIAN